MRCARARDVFHGCPKSSIVRRSTESNFLITENGLVDDRTHRVPRCCCPRLLAFRICSSFSLSLSLSLSVSFFARAWSRGRPPTLILCQTYGSDRPERGFEKHTQSLDTYCSLTAACIPPPLPHPPVAAGRFQFSFIGEHMRFFSSWSIKNRWDRCANYVSRMRTYKISFLRVVPRGCYFEAEFWLGTRLPGYLMAKLQSLLKRMIKLNFKVEPFEFSTRDAAVFTKLPSIPYAWEATKKMRFYLWMPSWSGWRITD